MGRNVDVEEVRDMRDQLNRSMVDMRDQLLRVIETGFKGTHHRQDLTNGRVGKLEETTGRFDERLEAVERDNEAFHQHRRASDPVPTPKPAPEPDEAGDNRRITQRDARLFVVGAGAAVGLFKILPWLVSLAQAGKP